MKRLLVTLITVLFYFSIQAQSTSSDFVYFDYDQFELTATAQESLNEIAVKIQSFSDFTLQIYGHTDQDGQNSYNQWLAKERADQVYHALISLGIDESRMMQNSFGESQLLINEESMQAKALNRRVEIKFTYQNFETTEDLLERLTDNSSEIFTEDGSEEIILELKYGSKVKIPANTLVFEDGSPVSSPVTIEVKEAFSMTHFAQNKLSCTSNDKMLESGGMMFVEAKSEGQILKVRDGASVAIEYPVQKVEEDMELFYGERDNSGRTNWNVANSDIDFTPDVDSEIEIDLVQFLEFRVEPIEKPEFNLVPMEAFPKMPLRPNAPNKPRLIDKDNVYISLSKMQKLLMPADKKEILRAQRYAELTVEYEARMLNYNEKYERYQNNFASYLQEVEKVNKERICWQEKAQTEYMKMLQYKHNKSKYNRQVKARDAQLFLERNLESTEPARIFNNFYNGLAHMPKEELYRKLAKYIFGPKFEDVIAALPNRFEGYKQMKLESVDKNLNSLISKANRYYNQIYYNTKKNLSSADLGRYTFNIASLGWINCDRFVEIRERVNFALIAPRGTQFFMVFDNINSMLLPEVQGEKFVFENIPSNQKVSIVGMNVEGNKPMLFVKEITTGPDMKMVPKFQKSSLADIRRVFQKFDS